MTAHALVVLSNGFETHRCAAFVEPAGVGNGLGAEVRAVWVEIGVFAAYASVKGRALVDRELYLPKS
nr:hypothetical protein [Streptomyces sp. NBRC 110030]